MYMQSEAHGNFPPCVDNYCLVLSVSPGGYDGVRQTDWGWLTGEALLRRNSPSCCCIHTETPCLCSGGIASQEKENTNAFTNQIYWGLRKIR